MQSKIKFSIVTIVYNGSACIGKTIDSIVNQTYDNYEYIIIDGNSKDNTLELCYEYKNKITKIVSEPDKGLYDAMNKGIEQATGDYIIFMNCDDTLYDELVLEKVASEINKNHMPDFVYGDAIEVSEDGAQEFLKKSRNHKMIWYGMFAHHQAMFYKMNVIKLNNIKYDLQYKIAADYALTANFFKYCDSYLYLDFVFCGFKQGGISMKDANNISSELFAIKKHIIGLNKFQIGLILILQKGLLYFRNNFNTIYNFIRFKNIK